MRSEEISGEALLQRMKTFAIEMLEARGASTHFHADADAADFPLSAEQRKELYLLFKEAVNNAAKYSGAADVRILLYTQSGGLRLEIRDNGRGFDPASIPRGNGLGNMKRKAERHRRRFPGQTRESRRRSADAHGVRRQRQSVSGRLRRRERLFAKKNPAG
jgi:two-component system sensor histidine kinase UhpB